MPLLTPNPGDATDGRGDITESSTKLNKICSGADAIDQFAGMKTRKAFILGSQYR